VVIQFNKRDLPDARTDSEISDARQRGGEKVIEAIAVRGVGVLETLHAVLQAAYRNAVKGASLEAELGLTEELFLRQIFGGIDTSGTSLEGLYALAGGGP
jgi:hypothetical protein